MGTMMKLVAVLGSASIMLAACQTVGPTMSLEDAREITAEFQTTKYYVRPPRTIDDVLRQIGVSPEIPLPDVCQATREEREHEMARIVDLVGTGSYKLQIDERAAMVLEAAAYEFGRGNYKRTIEYIEKAINSLPPKYHTVREAGFRAQLALVQSVVGDLDEAKYNRNRVVRLWTIISTSSWYNGSRRGPQMDRLFTAMANAAVDQAEGNLISAEINYHTTLDTSAEMPPDNNWYIDRSLVYSQLVTNLLSQGRMVEAEIMVRNAIREVDYINGWRRNVWRRNDLPSIAQLMAQYGEVLFEQNRLADAVQIVRLAVRMQQVGCAAPDSIASIKVRESLITVLAAQGDWNAVREQTETVRNALRDESEMLDRFLNSNIDGALALVHTGAPHEGLSLLNQALRQAEERGGPDSYAAAEMRSLLGVAQKAVGMRAQALENFQRSLPFLLDKREDALRASGVSRGAYRTETALNAYLHLLAEIRGTTDEKSAGIDAVKEMFRVNSESMKFAPTFCPRTRRAWSRSCRPAARKSPWPVMVSTMPPRWPSPTPRTAHPRRRSSC